MTAKARTRAKPEADPAPKAGSKAAIDPVQRFPRREKRKQETRFRLTKAAGRLFEQQGYADTTMAEIAAAADVHVTTLFTHFKSKRELAEAVSDRTLENLAQFIADNQGKRPFFEAQRELVAQIADAFQRKAPYKLTIGRGFGQDPELTATWMNYERRQIEMLAAYIAHDFAIDIATDYRPTLVANMLVGGYILAHQRWVASDGKSDLKSESLAALDAVEHIVTGGMKAFTPK